MTLNSLEPGRCSKRIYNGYYDHQCHNKATTPKGYCKMHDPDIVKAKSEARVKSRRDKWDSQNKALAEARAKQAEIERKAALYDALEKEREGEVVLGSLINGILKIPHSIVLGLATKSGEVIFRPTPADKEKIK